MIPTVPYPSPLLSLLSYLFAQRISPMNLKHIMAFATTNIAFVLNLLVNIYAFVDVTAEEPASEEMMMTAMTAGIAKDTRKRATNSIVAAVDILGGISIFFPFLQNKAAFNGNGAAFYFNHVFALMKTALLAGRKTLTVEDITMLGHLLQQLPLSMRSLELWEIVRQWLGADVAEPVRNAMVTHLLINGDIWEDPTVHATVCEWVCLALQNPEVSKWLRCCSFQQVQHEMKSDRVISAWCAEQSSLTDSEIRLFFAMPTSEVIVAVLEQWAMNEATCKRVCSVLNDGCIAWAMEQGATLEEGLKYNLMWVMKDVLEVYEESKRWTLMTDQITPWKTTEVILTRMLELEQYYWLPFVASSIPHVPAVLSACLASMEKYLEKMIVHPNWYIAFIPLLGYQEVYPVLASYLEATVRGHAQGVLSYDLTLAWLGLFTAIDERYGHLQGEKAYMIDVWVALCETYKTIIPQCEATMVWNAFGRTLEYFLQMMYLLLDEEENHFATNWKLLHTYIGVIQLIPATSTRKTLQALLVKVCQVLQKAENYVVVATADGKQSPLAGLADDDEEDLLSFGAPSKPEPTPEPTPELESELTSQPALTEEEERAQKEQSVELSEIEADVKALLHNGVGGDLRLAAEASRCMLAVPCLNCTVSLLLGACDDRIRGMLAESEGRLKKRWNVDRKKDESLIVMCM